MAEIILPSEENEETPQAPELNIDKPTVNSKVITIEFEAKKTNKVSTKDTNQQLYTTDTDAWFEFKETSLEGANGTYSVVFRNRHDGSIFQRTGDVVDGVAYYKIPHQEIRHAGAWRGQVVYTLSNGDTTAREFDYDVKGHILDGKDVREIVVEDFETLMSQLRSMKDNAEVELADLVNTANQNETDRQIFFDDLVEDLVDDIDELQANYQELLDTGVLQTNINTKLEALEEEYAPKLTEVTAQLGQTGYELNNEINKKIDKGNVSVNDINKNLGKFDQTYMTDEFIQQITGDTPVNNVISDKSITTDKLADKSVTMDILSFAESSLNLAPDEYLTGMTITVDGNIIANDQSRYMIIPIEGGKTYCIQKFDISNRLRVGVFGSRDISIGNWANNYFGTEGVYLEVPTTVEDSALFVVVTSIGEEPRLNVTEGRSYDQYLPRKYIPQQLIDPSLDFKKEANVTCVEDAIVGYPTRPNATSVTWIGVNEPSQVEPYDEWRETEGFTHFTDFGEYTTSNLMDDWSAPFYVEYTADIIRGIEESQLRFKPVGNERLVLSWDKIFSDPKNEVIEVYSEMSINYIPSGLTSAVFLKGTGSSKADLSGYGIGIIENGGQNELWVVRYVDGISTLLASHPVSVEIAQKFNLRVRIQGANISVKYWRGEYEPTEWTLTITDSDPLEGDITGVFNTSSSTGVYVSKFGVGTGGMRAPKRKLIP